MAAPQPTRREALLARLAGAGRFDLAVVGGGATGLGVALDAAVRGLRVLLVEAGDFARGTSSRSTKLVHGGVRYLAQGHVGLVREALHERAALLRNAPHLARPLPFVIPAYRRRDRLVYGAGLFLYDRLAGREGLGATEHLGPRQTLDRLPGLRSDGLRGGIGYWDGQFDDARLALALARTAAVHGALVLNYCRATDLCFEAGRVAGLRVRDEETGRAYGVAAACVVNATGVWVDTLRARDTAVSDRTPLVAPSQGVHLVVDADFLPGGQALMVPRTADGRVLFAVPWLGSVVLGTTDTPRTDCPLEPRPLAGEVDFILAEVARYLRRAPGVNDVRSLWAGLRPLVRPPNGPGPVETRSVSREHLIQVSSSGLVSVTGGKWTTYRAMAEQVLATARAHGLLPPLPASLTRDLPLVGAANAAPASDGVCGRPGLAAYGSEADWVRGLPGADRLLGGGLTEAMVRFAARHEYARTVADVLARRSRLLFLDAGLAASLAPAVGEVLRHETGGDPQVPAFVSLAAGYRLPPDAAGAAHGS